jgi:hypothetical protein
MKNRGLGTGDWGLGTGDWGLGTLSSVDFFAGSHWNAVSGTGSSCRSSAVCSALERAADAQKRVPTTTCLHLRGLGTVDLSGVDFFTGSQWNAVGRIGRGRCSNTAFPALERAADAQKRVPTTTCLHLRGLGTGDWGLGTGDWGLLCGRDTLLRVRSARPPPILVRDMGSGAAVAAGLVNRIPVRSGENVST